MLDPKIVRKEPERIKRATKAKGVDPKVVDRWLEVDKKRSLLMTKVEELRARRNKLVESFKGKKPSPREVTEARGLREKVQKQEKKLAKVAKEWQNLLWQVPNPAGEGVPLGKDESENVVARRWGKPKKFDFKPKDYLEIAQGLDLIDVKRAAKVSGPRFGYLKREAVLLEFALVRLAFETLLEEGFVPVLPPVMIKKEMEAALGYGEHGGWDEMYVLDKDNLVLVATSEHSLAAMHAKEVLEEKDLPLRYVAFSTCFRREAGSYGKDTRGILRVHQFNKIEMVCFTRPENSPQEHEYMVSLEERLMQKLELPYQVSQMCTGDLGAPAVKKYDIEAWFPAQNKYRETHSCSNCTDYQARRLGARFKRSGRSEFVHILNGTVFSERPILAILENYQQKDGSVVVPKVLRKWVGKDKLKGQS